MKLHNSIKDSHIKNCTIHATSLKSLLFTQVCLCPSHACPHWECGGSMAFLMALWLSGAEAYRKSTGQSFCAPLFHDCYPTWWNLFSLLCSHFISSWMLHNRMWILKAFHKVQETSTDKQNGRIKTFSLSLFFFKYYYYAFFSSKDREAHLTRHVYIHISRKSLPRHHQTE